MLTCVFISAKFYEKDSRGPTANDIQTISKEKFKSKDILFMEKEILKTLNWNLMVKTPADYVDLFLSQGVLFSNDQIIPTSEIYKRGQTKPDQTIATKLKDYSSFLLDLIV